MRSNFFILVFVLAVALTACNNESTPYGLTFTRHRTGTGPQVRDGEYLVMNLVAIDENDSVWHDTYKENQPMIVRVAPPVLPGLKEPGETGVYRMLHVGDSVSFDIDAETIYVRTWNQELPNYMDPGLEVTYQLSVIEIVDEEGLEKYRLRNLERYEAERIENQIRQYGKDTTAIANYLKEKSIVAVKTLSGLSYTVDRDGTGPVAKSGKKVAVRYTGKLLNGNVFDSNLDAVDPFVVNVGRGDVIAGWEEALQLVKKGGKYTFYIPSLYGYADQGSGAKVPPNAVLVFEMEVKDIQ